MNARPTNPGTAAAALWVVGSAGLTLGGWGLSLAGQLNRTGCGVLVAALVVLSVGWLRAGWPAVAGGWRPRRRRWRSPWAAGWLGLWILATLGGALHAPNNIDALTYRLPRVLHWLAAEGWHWIATNDPRMNYSAAGMEWQMAPLLALMRSDRLFFLLNALPALLLPGLAFSFLRGTGVRGRVAWRWMWLLPAGHVFILQTGSIGNDANGALYFLAACHFAQVAAARGGWRWLACSLVAAGLMTGWKTSNLPLLLPYALVAWPAWRAARGRGTVLAAVLLVATAGSALPTLVLNQVHAGHWSGDPGNVTAVRLASPVSGLAGNTLQAAWQNLVPPVFPWAGGWNAWSAQKLEPAVRRVLGDDFPRFSLRAGELAQEEWAGLGLLLGLLALGGCRRGAGAFNALAAAGWVSATILCLGLGSEMTARLLAPYYPVLMLPLLRCGGQDRWLASRSGRVLAGLAFASTAAVLAVSPARPLLPVAEWTASERVTTVYEVYARRADSLRDLRAALPAGVDTVGFLATADDAETSLWRPYGTRRVVRVAAGEAPRMEWVVVRADALWPTAAEERAWLERWGGNVMRRQTLRLKASRPPEQWALVRLTPADNGAGR